MDRSDRRVGLLGVATYLPPEIRRNDWWPAATVERWRARSAPPMPPPGALTPAMARVVAAMSEQAADPFGGVAQRHVMPAEMASVDMEARAAERAIAHAQAHAPRVRDEIDVLFTHTAVPDYLLSNTACVLHRALGLAPSCFTMQAEASGHSFMMQLTLAEHLIASGRARYALLVQSCAASRLIDPDDPQSPLFGDGAAAVVVGPAGHGGLLATVHRTDGSHPRALVASVRGGRWYDPGRLVLHSADPGAARQIFLETADRAIEVVGAALQRAGRSAGDVAFFAVHQGTPWLRRVTQEAIGLDRARTVDSFPETGYLFGASIPLVLEAAQRRGLVERGDLVVLHGGGVGSTYGAIVLDWGDPVA
ncbi:MAG TPA: 3-oxoacyl-[acyl-carrier-protein] synthase III C-terminal domain-containing protein [Kofleriaceae bacterium]|nr:3-oxoacyl-[acyl-carrier-protein] synthase III C-terminal domain-containing protein [Kofleriaceae bacterium]